MLGAITSMWSLNNLKTDPSNCQFFGQVKQLRIIFYVKQLDTIFYMKFKLNEKKKSNLFTLYTATKVLENQALLKSSMTGGVVI